MRTRRALRVGVLAPSSLLIAAGLLSLFFFRRTQEQNTRVYAAITRMQTGMLTQLTAAGAVSRAREDATLLLPAGDRKSLNCSRRAKN